MDIVEACAAIRDSARAVNSGQRIPLSDAELCEAVFGIKRFLELARMDGQLIHELEIADYLLCTPQGIRWVMPFVTRAEEVLAASARALPNPKKM
jgi:hypothetical protein